MPQEFVTYSRLGVYGRLGNHLWQAAAVVGTAHQHGLGIRLPSWAYAKAFSLPDEWFGIPQDDDLEAASFAPHLQGPQARYLQDPTIWWSQQDAVRAALTPAPAIQAQVRASYGAQADLDDATAIHVRRGDYLELSAIYPQQTRAYFEQALERIEPADRRPDRIIFSDDPGWVVENLGFIERSVVLPGQPAVVDLACQALCRRHVIANSSFSWWGAFLAGTDSVVAPRSWYTDEYKHFMPDSLIPAAWHRL